MEEWVFYANKRVSLGGTKVFKSVEKSQYSIAK